MIAKKRLTGRESPAPELPHYFESPPTPARPPRMTKIPTNSITVIEGPSGLYDQVTLYRLHAYAPPKVFEGCGGLLSLCFNRLWHSPLDEKGIDTDAKPGNRVLRAKLVALAERASSGQRAAELDVRRAWRVVDWEVRVRAAALMDLAGWHEHASAFRALPPIVGEASLTGAGGILRRAYHHGDRESTKALRGAKPYRRDQTESARVSDGRTMKAFPACDVGRSLSYALQAVPEVHRLIGDPWWPYRGRTALALGLEAGGHARMCVDQIGRAHV